MTPTQIACAFVDAINSADLDRVSELMTKDHVFIDADGSRHCGGEEMRQQWGQYLSMVPDFRSQVTEALCQGSIVALFGIAEGTFDQDGILKPENHWKVPAAWRVVVEGDRVAVWQLYVNPQPMAEIMNRLEWP
jgi:ketosteroid isomerase-like protein